MHHYTSSAIMPRATIHEIAAHRDRALSLFAQAFDLVAQASDAARRASPSGVYSLPSLAFDRSYPLSAASFADKVRQTVDRAVWNHVTEAHGITSLMDKTEREKLRGELERDAPPFNAEDCQSVVERLIGDRKAIFQRGLANAFSSLDRRFRSHDGFKIGSRIVLTHAFDRFGSWSRGYRDETVLDVERAFHLLDGRSPPTRMSGIVGLIASGRRAQGYEASQFVVEDEYFKARVFQNGNIHLWFKRSDLVEKVNLNLADHYGAVLGAGADVATSNPGPKYGREVSRGFDFYPSPDAVVARVLDEADIHMPSERYVPKTMRVLEPNAGAGALSRPAAEAGHAVSCIEIQAQYADQLAATGRYAAVVVDDFLAVSPDRIGRFDRILMNPPFGDRADVDHVAHALSFLAPGGKLVAVMASGIEYRSDARTVALRDRIEALDGRISPLPALSFAEVGTNVNTVIVTVRAPQ